MKIIKKISEKEMIAEFLSAEIDSSQFRPLLVENLPVEGHKEDIIRKPDLNNEKENQMRGLLLNYRGYPDRGLFEGLPKSRGWYIANLKETDLKKLLTINCEEWIPNSNKTRNFQILVRRLRDGEIEQPTILKIAHDIDQGKEFPLPIVLHDLSTDKFVVLEGNKRVASMTLLGLKSFQAIVGEFDSLKDWRWG